MAKSKEEIEEEIKRLKIDMKQDAKEGNYYEAATSQMWIDALGWVLYGKD